MSYILTDVEAANVLRCEPTDPLMLDLLAAVDASIEIATGRDWSADTTIDPIAKQYARLLLRSWHEGDESSNLKAAILACAAQLEALALSLETSGIPEEALEIVTSNPKDGDDDLAITISPVIIFNNEMAAAATSCAVLQNSAGATVTGTNTLDATGKIMTVTPTASLSALTTYTIVITAAPDIYGQTITETIRFRTA